MAHVLCLAEPRARDAFVAWSGVPAAQGCRCQILAFVGSSSGQPGSSCMLHLSPMLAVRMDKVSLGCGNFTACTCHFHHADNLTCTHTHRSSNLYLKELSL